MYRRSIVLSLLAMLAIVCGGCSADGTHEVTFVASVEGPYRAGSFNVLLSSPGTNLHEGGTPDGPVWRKTIDVASPPADLLMFGAQAEPDPSASSGQLLVTCSITVDGEELAKETDRWLADCTVHMYDVTGVDPLRPPPPAGGLWGWLGALLAALAILAVGAVILWRSRRRGPRTVVAGPDRAEAPPVAERPPDPVLEPQIRFLHVCALGAVLAIGFSIFAACSTTAELPPGVHVPSVPASPNRR